MPQFTDDVFLGSAQTFMGTGVSNAEAIVSATISGTTLTVVALLSGDSLSIGQYIVGSGVTANSYITAINATSSGTTYTLSQSSTVGSATTMYASGNVYLGDSAPMDLGVGPMGRIYMWDVVPQTLQTANIAVSQTASAAGNLTLTAGTSAKVVVRADGTSVIQLDCARAVQVNCSTTARAFTISGYDYYGQPMSEVITVATAGTAVSGKKAFYQISTAYIAGSATACVVGTTDTIGLPVRVFDAGYIASVGWNNTLARDTGTFTAADLTTPATSSTGDVRGTYAVGTSNGSKRLVMGILVPSIGAGPTATRVGALGVTQA